MNIRTRSVWCSLLRWLCWTGWLCGGVLSLPSSHQAPRALAADRLDQLPLPFEPVAEPADARVRYFARGPDYGLLLATDEAILHRPGSQTSLHMRWSNAQPAAAIEPLDVLPGKSNYFHGNHPEAWRTDVPNYGRVRYRQIYPGIDLVFYGNQRVLEYDFVLAPYADPSRIQLLFEGAAKMELAEHGELLLHVGGEVIRQPRPVAYQETDQGRINIAADYQLDADSVRFELGAYDPRLPLVIDPLVLYASYLGGNNTDVAHGIAVDREGNIYLTGQTFSPNFPVKAPVDTLLDGANDAFVMKLDPTGSRMLYSTFIGGRGSNDRGWAIAVDGAGNVYFTGETNSLNFPTANAAQPAARGNGDAFAAKLNIAGNVLLYSTFLGGSLSDVAYAIALDQFDNAYITGRTESANFLTKNPLQTTLRGQRDPFILRLDPDGVLLASTFFGGAPATTGGLDDEAGYGIAVDKLQNVYVTGLTTSPLFPTLNAVQANFGGVEDGFIVKLDLTGARLIYSTYLGGQRADAGRGIAVDGFGNAYVTGYTISSDFPLKNPLQPVYGSASDAFITKLNAQGTAFVYSTYLGGSGEENTGLISDVTPVGSLAVDALGYVYLTGKTGSANFPLARAIQGELRGNNDAFISKLDQAGSALVYSTYFGTSFNGNNGLEERGLGLVVDGGGTAYLTGQMQGTDLLTVAPLQNRYNGGLSDAFILKLSTPDIISAAPVSAASFNGAQFAPESIIALFGNELAPAAEAASSVQLPTSLQGTSVKVLDKNNVERLAPLFFVSPNQLNLLLPPCTAPGAAKLTVTTQTGATLSCMTQVEAAAPALFTANSTGQGLAAAIALRIKPDGTQSFSAVGQYDLVSQRVVPVPIDLGAEGDQTFLLLFGTGLRGRSELSAVSVRIGGSALAPQFVGAQGNLAGLDQMNVPLPRGLAGRGEVSIQVTVDGLIANPVTVTIR
jgi:uncharacterized protein (TIGR03437 family)